MESDALRDKIHDLLHASIRAYGVEENDAVSLRTLKVFLVGRVLEGVGLDWSFVHNLFKNHTPVHPEWSRYLSVVGDEDAANALAQGFVRNEKLVRMLKTLTQHGFDMDRILAVDGLSGNNLPNFEQKNYVGNLKYGSGKTLFDSDPEYKRLHVRIVRTLYETMRPGVPAPQKQVYETLRRAFERVARIELPAAQFEADEGPDEEFLKTGVKIYVGSMGEKNIEDFVKNNKKFRSCCEKRPRDDATGGADGKMSRKN